MHSLALTPQTINDADVSNARRLLSHHGTDSHGQCRACHAHFPCVPALIAETVLSTAATRAA